MKTNLLEKSQTHPFSQSPCFSNVFFLTTQLALASSSPSTFFCSSWSPSWASASWASDLRALCFYYAFTKALLWLYDVLLCFTMFLLCVSLSLWKNRKNRVCFAGLKNFEDVWAAFFCVEEGLMGARNRFRKEGVYTLKYLEYIGFVMFCSWGRFPKASIMKVPQLRESSTNKEYHFQKDEKNS